MNKVTYAIVIQVLPSLIFARDVWIAFSVAESSDAVASSIRIIVGAFKMARAMAICVRQMVQMLVIDQYLHYRCSKIPGMVTYPLFLSPGETQSAFPNLGLISIW